MIFDNELQNVKDNDLQNVKNEGFVLYFCITFVGMDMLRRVEM